jgi:hypothetical protein
MVMHYADTSVFQLNYLFAGILFPASVLRRFLPASGTQTVQFQLMILHDEIIFFCNILLERFNAFILELDNGTALRADEMIVVVIPALILKARKTIVKSALFSETCRSQELQRPVHRCVPDSGMLFLHPSMQFFDAHVPSGFHKYRQDDIALTRGSEPLVGEKICQSFCGIF